MGEETPSWNLLPHNPLAFFELQPGFDRKTLKRKYNQLIRKYKPEKHPAKFQQIRAAYELLDSQLRYGESVEVDQENQFQWEVPRHQESTLQQPISLPNRSDHLERIDANPPENDVEIPIYQRVEVQPLKAIYEEYKRSRGKSPYDYYAMALIADVATDDPLAFLKVLLTGCQKHQHEQGLLNLLAEYLKQDFEPKISVAMLKTISKVVSDRRFYYLTEKLWDDLLRKLEFANWAQLLKKCEANLNEFRVESRLAFYIHILPIAAFKAEGNWLRESLDFVESHSMELPEWLEADLEQVYQLLEYRKSLVDGNSHSPEIHNAICQFYLTGGRDGDKAVIDLQNAFAENPSSLLNRYDIDTPFNEHQVAVWRHINDDVCNRYGLIAEMDPTQLRAKIYELMNDLNLSEHAAFGWKEELQYYWWNWGAYGIAAISPFVLLSIWLNAVTMSLATVLAIAAVAVTYFWFQPGERYLSLLESRMGERYMSHWRGRFVHLFQATQIEHSEFSDAMLEIVQDHSEKLGFASWLARFLPADLGLYLYALAARYLR